MLVTTAQHALGEEMPCLLLCHSPLSPNLATTGEELKSKAAGVSYRGLWATRLPWKSSSLPSPF